MNTDLDTSEIKSQIFAPSWASIYAICRVVYSTRRIPAMYRENEHMLNNWFNDRYDTLRHTLREKIGLTPEAIRAESVGDYEAIALTIRFSKDFSDYHIQVPLVWHESEARS